MIKNYKISVGKLGEKIAVEYMEKAGYKIIIRNFRAGRYGEIDIIAQQKEYLTFVEVKTRSNIDYGMPSESVNKRKQQNIRKLAYMYINKNNIKKANIRFDIIEIMVKKMDNGIIVKNINLIKNAF